MRILELMKKRRSIRKYKTTPLSRQLILRIIEAASFAPSGLNRQPWFFVAVSNPSLKEEIRRECERCERNFYARINNDLKKSLSFFNLSPVKPFLTEAPYLIVVFVKEGEPYGVESVWISIGYMILKIEEEGLASLTYTPPDMSFLNSVLGISSEFKAVAILPVGYPDEKIDLGKRKRKPVNKLVKFIE
ncbi:nitroreductase family protein [Candidatus Aerophobetes bacterium]|uniref:Nitroreductase family protein n=1 Tax=Aerophobetes bacterium TaxID=2030807 RepID=A0A662DCE4_UNCAE|nr:MAG: nitroreductase family protein [Candidatus Aerophobetes bacterium]